MTKKLVIFSLLFLISLHSFSQKHKQGIVNRKFSTFQVGDTVNILGYKETEYSERTQYLIKSSFDNVHVNTDRIDLIDDDFTFWENQWFKYRARDIQNNGWYSSNRDLLHTDAMEFLEEVKQNNLVFEDEVLYDYLYQLIFKIHPSYLIKDKNRVVHLAIIKSTEPTYFSFDNGMIILTTGSLSLAKDEADIVKMLSECLANTVLDHNLINLNQAIKAENRARTWGTITTLASSAVMAYGNAKNGTYYNFDDAYTLGLAASYLTAENMQRIGANYNNEQNKLVKSVAAEYWKEHIGQYNTSNKQVMAILSNAISYTAWQEFYSKNYEYSLLLAERIESMEMATEDEYLLLSKLYRRLGNDLDTNLQALTYINNAREMALEPMVDLDLEEGLIYLRMEDFKNAKTSFLKYRENLIALQRSGDPMPKSDLKYINQILRRFNMHDEDKSIGVLD
ncbi:hypothetical protein ACFOUP_07320 [Belliella kenyensis]|uniref:Tetratricopeptide repeat protein n=1 Tax=Belliella kenyensis TaxID=1472724 RepID=A0ABV8EKK8_9BACT|nr:hypothetical protein [Belliella kenyensis]MCH7400282.1 hypothetical protein [Belliella kenyensis]MDN3604700.1 hypothetical protein [Belliella kenyensis]MDN3605262.1 hypothetical protein [Belliella kenyensis]